MKNYYGELEKLIEKDKGIYLVGSCHFNPHTGERYYLIKCGMGKDIYERLKHYPCYNPSHWIIDTLVANTIEDAREYEKEIHEALSELKKGKPIETVCHSHSTEWFSITRKDYLRICDKGFQFFYK